MVHLAIIVGASAIPQTLLSNRLLVK